MKITGSNYWDTLFGTSGIDTIHGNNGNDLIRTGGGRDSIYGDAGNDLISGFSFNLDAIEKSPYRGSLVNGGSGSDTLMLDIDPSKGTSVLARAAAAMNIQNVEENIYNVSSVTAKQVIVGTRKLETICTTGTADVRGMEGNDYIFTDSGDDKLSGGGGNDFLSGGVGHDTLTGGSGRDQFMFQLATDKGYQYSNITDFNVKGDKISIAISVDQFNLARGTDIGPRLPNHTYGDGVQGNGILINDYVNYDNGRIFDRGDFKASQGLFDDFVTYEKSTGSILINYYSEDDTGVTHDRVLVAHIDGNKALDSSDFNFLVL